MRTTTRTAAVVLAAIFAATAHATGDKPPTPAPDPSATSNASATAAAKAAAAADASAKAKAEQAQTATAVVEDRRDAPAIGQGSIVLAGCGFAGNAGGSEPGGAAFLGVAFMTRACWDQVTIQNEAAMGNVKTACEMNRLTKSGKRQVERLKAAGIAIEPCPDRAPAAPAADERQAGSVVVVPGQDLTGYATRTELRETVDRAVKAMAGK